MSKGFPTYKFQRGVSFEDEYGWEFIQREPIESLSEYQARFRRNGLCGDIYTTVWPNQRICILPKKHYVIHPHGHALAKHAGIPIKEKSTVIPEGGLMRND